MTCQISFDPLKQSHGCEIFNPVGAFVNKMGILALPEVKKARGFFQCDSREYLLIEFWTSSEDDILNAGAAIEKYLGI